MQRSPYRINWPRGLINIYVASALWWFCKGGFTLSMWRWNVPPTSHCSCVFRFGYQGTRVLSQINFAIPCSLQFNYSWPLYTPASYLIVASKNYFEFTTASFVVQARERSFALNHLLLNAGSTLVWWDIRLSKFSKLVIVTSSTSWPSWFQNRQYSPTICQWRDDLLFCGQNFSPIL